MKVSVNNIFEYYKNDNIDVLIIFGHHGLDTTNATFLALQNETGPNLQFGDFGEICQNENIGNTALYTICDSRGDDEGFTNEELQNTLLNALQPLSGKFKNVGILTPTPYGYNAQDLEAKAQLTYQTVATVKSHFADHWSHGDVTLYTMSW